MKVFLVHFNGVYIPGYILSFAGTKRQALNQAKKELKDRDLLDKNRHLTLHDVEELDTDKRYTYVITDGDY